jgi:hypothetical protein
VVGDGERRTGQPPATYAGDVLRLFLVILLVAVVIYLSVRLWERRGVITKRTRRPQQPPPRALGPDDDPDFLRDLDKKRKRRDDTSPGDNGGS